MTGVSTLSSAHINLALVSVILLGLAVAPVTGVVARQFSPAATGIALTIDFGNGTLQEFQDLEGANVYEVTDSATQVEVEWYGDLVYVISISGVHEDDSADLYWQYWVNGELGGSAANKHMLQDGDLIEWKLPSQTSDASTTPTDLRVDVTLIIGGGLLGVVAISVLILLWIKQQRG